VGHAPRGRLEDRRAAAEVACKHDRLVLRVALDELDDVDRARASEPVDHLILVPAHDDVPIRPREQEYQLGLGPIDVLEFDD
jgi:hypothetical protein